MTDACTSEQQYGYGSIKSDLIFFKRDTRFLCFRRVEAWDLGRWRVTFAGNDVLQPIQRSVRELKLFQ